jgi:hypothetical protein
MSAAAVFDLDAAAAARREAAGEPFRFTWHGEEYAMLPAVEWPVTVAERMSKGEMVEAVRLLLGDDADRFLATDPTMGDIKDLMEAVAAYSGLGSLGE